MKRNLTKRVEAPKRPPDERYDVQSYGTAIDRACDRAFPPPERLRQRAGESRERWWGRLTSAERDELRAWRKAHMWHPNQLRHSFATEARKLFSLEHAGAALGHTKMSATEVYAERDAGLGSEVARRIG